MTGEHVAGGFGRVAGLAEALEAIPHSQIPKQIPKDSQFSEMGEEVSRGIAEEVARGEPEKGPKGDSGGNEAERAEERGTTKTVNSREWEGEVSRGIGEEVTEVGPEKVPKGDSGENRAERAEYRWLEARGSLRLGGRREVGEE